MAEHYIHNGEKEKTIAALKRVAAKATGEARRVIQGLAKALNPNDAARGRKAKGAASMAKKRTKKATAKAKAKHNPSGKRWKKSWKRRHNPSGLASKVRGMDLTGIALEGAGVAAGSLALSFVDRQAQRILPDLNPMLRSALSTALVAGGLAYLSKGRGFVRSMSVGAVASGVTQVASALAPGLFAGLDDEELYPEMGGWDADGNWNEELGAAEFEEGDDMGGVVFDRSSQVPALRSF